MKMQREFLKVFSVHATGPAERLLHEPLLGEAGPPLGGTPVRSVEDALAQSGTRLVPQLGQK